MQIPIALAPSLELACHAVALAKAGKHGNLFVYSRLSAATRDDQSEHETSSSESEKEKSEKGRDHWQPARQIQASRSDDCADGFSNTRSTTRSEDRSNRSKRIEHGLTGVRCRNLVELSPQTIAASGVQKSAMNSPVKRVITFAYSAWNASFRSFARCPSGSMMSMYRLLLPEMNSQNSCPQSLR